MKNVLIFGGSSYIAKQFASYVKNHDVKINTTLVSSRGSGWRKVNFAKYDAVLYCAGVAHVKERPQMAPLYNRVHAKLALEVAQKSKVCGVKQFVYISTMAVYGNDRIVDEKTIPSPTSLYGKSKLKGEEWLKLLGSKKFAICIVRPPMVYGPGCKGNFPRLVKLAKWLPVFPKIENKRSMIFVDNLSEYIVQAVLSGKGGIGLPQNAQYVNTTNLVVLIASINGKTMATTAFFNPLIGLFSKFVPQFDKLFGSLVYETSCTKKYNVVPFAKGVIASLCYKP